MKEVKLKFLEGEYWYGGAVNDGYIFPLSCENDYKLNIDFNDTYNQINPLYLSSKGRYIWLEKGGQIAFNKGEILIIAEEVEINDNGKTLKEAQQNAAKKHFPSNGSIPDEVVFKSPQICSWIVFQHNQNQEKVLSYAKSYVKAGYPTGSYILDNSWQKNYGDWDFNRGIFPNPKKLTEELHAMGFKVVLWFVPYIAPDAEACQELIKNNGLITDENGNPRLMTWWDGDSYALDFTKPFANEWIKKQFQRLKEDYDVDGFKLDGGDSQFLWKDYPLANRQNELWARTADEIDGTFVELRGCYKNAGRGYIQRLADKSHIWGVDFITDEVLPDGGYLKYGLSTLVPDMLVQGLLGYYYGCPDMVGGGLAGDFDGVKPIDKELIVRSCQCSALMPMIQFSYPLWTDEDILLRNTMKSCLTMRENFSKYIMELAQGAKTTNEPIVRYMEYEYPHEGLEKVTSQFLLGNKYIVAPITEKEQTEKTVYIPKSTKWRRMDNGVTVEATQTFAVDINTILVFEKI